MLQRPLISIALCTYNGSQHLEQQLDSILKQSWTNLELIIVDDCSTDNTWSILTRYAGRHSNIRIFQNKQNIGFVKNFQEAIGRCSGELIALADQDDVWDETKLEKQASAIGDNLLIYHDSEFINSQGATLNRFMSQMRNFYRGSDNRVFMLENCVSGHSCLFKRSLLPYLLPLPEGIFHDWWLAFVATTHGSIDFLPQALVKYRQHSAANTDILRAGPAKKHDPLEQMHKESKRMNLFANAAPSNTHIRHFAHLLEKRLEQYFCFRLALLVLGNLGTFLYIQKKSPLSKFNIGLKYLWGYKLKKK